MTRNTAWLLFVLVLMGAGWGATLPLTKVAVSEGYRNFGIIVWQMAIGAVVLGAYLGLRGRLRWFDRRQVIFCTFIALVGTVIPNGASYQAAVYLPAGILSIVIAAVPMFAFPIALALGLDRFSWPRIMGLLLGLGGVALLAAPDSIPTAGTAIWVLVALVGPAFYAIEGNAVARVGTYALSPVEVLFGASVIGTLISIPLAIGTGTWVDTRAPFGAADYAIMASSTLHVLVYASYVWMVGRAGPVFAAQVSYLVTGFGVIWAMIFLGETYSSSVWIALCMMVLGVFMVQPRENDDPLARPG